MRMTRSAAGWAFALAAFIALAAAAAPAAAQPQGGDEAIALALRPGQEGPTISRHLFGQFAEHLGTGIYGGVWVGEESPIPNVRGIRSDVVAALRALRVPNVRWPGGCFADEYHWRDGIGPRAQRPTTLNPNWGGVTESNQFGTHEFFDFVDQIGSEAYVSLNLATGSPREAAEWLEYMTTPQPTRLGRERAANGRADPYRLLLLGLGNESWGCGGAMSADHYVEEMKSYARFARNFNPDQTGENAMRRIAVGPDGASTAYTEAVMQAWRDKVWSWDIEGISLHYYTTGGWPPSYDSARFGTREYAALIAETLNIDRLISTHAAIMDRHDPERRIGLYVDEWGVWLAPLPGTNPGFLQQQSTLRDAVIAALNLNIFARHAERVRGANIAQMVNVLQPMIFTDGPRMVLTPTYHLFRMYVPFQEARFVPLQLAAGTYRHGDLSLPRLDAIAARAADGALWLAVTNVDPERPASLSLNVEGMHLRSAAGEVLTAPRVDSHNSLDAPDAVRPRPIAARVDGTALRLDLPATSVAVLRLEAER
ncbi:alpha-N-arabinofuranosidase [Sphingosinicella terrae]|uniref:alpha-N-arabinofuranosidase n=1 Tax=Sphingosinicella terrae TaxID=2172047 RepID=UPI00254999EC|nr:alpha-L-arabinofuranosidase C-terminal domain-containing protein [Sphingosinicella terrae]